MILIVLTLFTLVALTFVVIARQHRGSARAAMKQDRYHIGHEAMLYNAALQVVRGSTDPGSALFSPIDLSSDMFGLDSFPPVSTNTPATIANVFAVDTLDNTTLYRYHFFDFTCSHTDLAPEDGHYNGRVLTMLDGPRAGDSTRVVGYSYNTGTNVGRFHVLRFTKTPAPSAGDRFIVNGGAFNGLGFGFDGNGQATAASNPLRPNNPGNVLGGPDEDYDIPDYNNVILAGRVWRGGRWETLIPSFYRPALINYWYHQSSGQPPVKDIMFNAFLPGSIPDLDADGDGFISLNELNLDVDTDGDGLLDAIWVDLGFPVQTNESGELYKPLFALQVIDLDGRLSLNAHGTTAHVAGIPFSPTGNYAGTPGPSASANLPVGQGYGPADVQLRLLFASNGSFTNLLNGNGTWDGRYGASGVPGKSGLDWLSAFRLNEYMNYGTAYASPPDMDADGQLGLDKMGQPIYTRMGEADDSNEHPYESNPSQITATDRPFTWSELEPLLRQYDLDAATLPQRLVDLTSAETSAASGPKFRGQVTTTSYDLPSPSVIPTAEMRYRNDASNLSFEDMLRQRLELSSIVDYTPAATDSNGLDDDNDGMTDEMDEAYPLDADASVATMIPPDLGSGVRFDINKPFGNGTDTGQPTNSGTQNGIVGEIGEPLGNAWPAAGSAPAAYSAFAGVNFDQSSGLHRQQYAKHLYILAMLAKDREYRLINGGGLSNENQHRLTAIRLAQWAVNVVDFRDRDSIMTPFEFDLDPFRDANGDGNTWDVDDDYTTTDGDPDQDQYRYVVFGCERPELLITETLAFHDCRTEDTANEPAVGIIPGTTTMDLVNPDTDFDQVRRPQGSLFVELFAPWLPKATGDADFPTEFKTNPSAATAIDLSKLAPVSSNGFRYPVWQLAIGERPDLADPETTFNPQRSELLDKSETLTIDKFVWFTSKGIYEAADSSNRSPSSVPGIGSRIHFYHLDDWTAPGPTDIVDYENRVNFDDSGSGPDNNTVREMFLVRPGEYTVIGPRVKTTIWRGGVNTAMPSIAANSTTANADLIRIQLLSESATAPRPPQTAAPFVTTTGGMDGGTHIGVYPDDYYGGGDSSHGIKASRGIVINKPRALSISEPISGYAPTSTDPTKFTQDPDDANVKYWDVYDPPLDAPEDPVTLRERQTDVPTYRKQAYLQRLANPLAPWHQEHNPYITVDHAPIELHAYNGQTGDQDPAVGANQDLRFASMERSGNNQNLWTNQTYSRHPSAGLVGGDVSGYAGRLIHSLGYLNTRYWLGNSISARTIRTADGYSAGNQYVGAPRQPFPWLTWQNRPFISNLEMLTVPASSPSRLLTEYSMGAGGGHLLDFITSTSNVTSDDSNTGSWASAANARGNLFRMFEFLHVPSRYTGSYRMLTPQHFVNSNGAYRPPQNVVSMFRDPGRVNINTIFDDGDIWQALLNDFPNARTHWNAVRNSRQGYGTAGPLPLNLNNNSPTYFANPFRSFGSSGTVAVNELKYRNVNTSGTPRTLIESTLLRPHPSGSQPLLAADASFGNGNSDYRNVNRNVFFATEPMTRLGNNLTTHSNTYAAWITVGFFGVNAVATPDRRVNPDGFTLGSELGSDTGDIIRHRAFFVIDRSIPYGFRNRGENLNAEKAIVLRKFIE